MVMLNQPETDIFRLIGLHVDWVCQLLNTRNTLSTRSARVIPLVVR